MTHAINNNNIYHFIESYIDLFIPTSQTPNVTVKNPITTVKKIQNNISVDIDTLLNITQSQSNNTQIIKIYLNKRLESI